VNPRVHLLLVLLLGTAVISIQASIKERPDPKRITDLAEQMMQPARWIGKYPPDFTAPTLDGGSFTLSSEVGKKVIVLNFFATWCGPCREETPEMMRFADKHAKDPFLFLGIDASERRDLVAKFVQDLKIGYPIALDASGEVQKKYGIRSFPTTIVIGATGRILHYDSGAILNADVALEPLLPASFLLISKGQGVSTEVYRRSAASERYGDAIGRREQGTGKLSGRAREIARKMPCPCGCTDTVEKCGCQTARKVTTDLAAGNFGDKSDVEVARDLNGKYCGLGME
jgi:cytochrome c biogenesis protein CcmG/thiol:disulfide interchange protein DsbE